VLRSLPVTASLSDVQECLGSLRPISIDFHQDEDGVFKGTVFVRIASVDDALKLVETGCTLDGKKVKAELLRSGGSRRTSFTSQIDTSKLTEIEGLITQFLNSDQQECYLPATLNADQRKQAHALAEKHLLTHATTSPAGSLETTQLRVVRLSKRRHSRTSLNADAPVFTPLNAGNQAPARLPAWLSEKRTSLVISDAARQD